MFSANPQVVSALRPDHLELILFVTERCPFRCTYCYQQFDLGKMPPEVQIGIRRLIQTRTDLKSLMISWFGGEPLAALDVVRSLGRFFYRECDSRDIDYSSAITTNGYLLSEEVFRELVRYGVKRFQITLDGDEEHHDATRHLASGAGSFAVIINNLLLMHNSDHDFSVSLRVHYHRDNVNSIYTLIDQLADLLRGDDRFVLYFEAVHPWGSPRDDSFRFADANYGELLAKYAQGKLGVASPPPSYLCYACKANSLAIRSNGRIAKCTVALKTAANDIGYLKESGEIVVDNDRFRRWVSPLFGTSKSDQACPLPSVLKGADGAV